MRSSPRAIKTKISNRAKAACEKSSPSSNLITEIKMLKGTVGLVTGAASGLGRATAERFVKEGAKVTLVDLSTSDGAKVAAEMGPSAQFVPVDVTKEEDVANAIQQTKEKFGRLDAAVNCAGIGVAFKTYNFNKNLPHKLEDFTKVRRKDCFKKPLLQSFHL